MGNGIFIKNWPLQSYSKASICTAANESFCGYRKRTQLMPLNVCSVLQSLLRRSLSHWTVSFHVPKICSNMVLKERLVFNHLLLKHFLQGARCQQPVISGVPGGSWQPFKRAAKAFFPSRLSILLKCRLHIPLNTSNLSFCATNFWHLMLGLTLQTEQLHLPHFPLY